MMLAPLILDWETYFSTKDRYSLKKGKYQVKTSAYVMHDLFRAHCVGIRDTQTGESHIRWYQDIPALLEWARLNERPVICHNHMFDGAISYWRYGYLPPRMICTMLMSFAVFGGALQRHSLDAVSQHITGQQVKQVGGLAKYDGVRDIPVDDRADMETYLLRDLEATQIAWDYLRKFFTELTYVNMDWSVRSFVDSQLELDVPRLREYQAQTRAREEIFWKKIAIPKSTFTSSKQFAELVAAEGVPVPMKLSVKQQKMIPALAKNDEGFINMMESSDRKARNLALLRQHAQSNIEATRTASMLKHANITPDKRWPLHVNFSGAMMTHRLSGGDGAGGNPLNLPRGSELRYCIKGAAGQPLLVRDQSKFELMIARTLAGDTPTVMLINSGGDPYCDFASGMYKRPITKSDSAERQVGKTGELQLQYGSGAKRLRSMLIPVGVELTMSEAQEAVNYFRFEKHRQVYDYWQYLKSEIIPVLLGDAPGGVPLRNAPFLTAHKNRIQLPSGLSLNYADLAWRNGEYGNQLMFRNFGTERGLWDNLYEAKLYQHMCQTLANEVMMLHKYQLLEAGHQPVLEVYDELGCVLSVCRTEIDVLDQKAQADDIQRIMETPPPWWPELTLKSDGGIGDCYGDCKA